MDWKWWNSNELKIQNSIRRFRDLYAKVAVKQRICLYWDTSSKLEMKLEIPRVGEEDDGWEEVCDFEPCLKTNFGTSMNALPNFSIKMSGIQTSCWDKWPFILVNSQHYTCYM
ncbi:hypothetical protein AVEN_201352-1 [Araneus ventricosus]|uniref:Uncharacterized protein n=1 Tax=Araneus ventricosus TaxID=182803 RepID=A0A4Y2SIA6_ARAVE|nr:hypothetical protein AVEN_114100-1 [Araneus ventricosus]GBN87503.1 hypothetical protein AVEN_201352-1 [Araneus ventricosus]